MREPRRARAEASSGGPGRLVLGQPNLCGPPQNRPAAFPSCASPWRGRGDAEGNGLRSDRSGPGVTARVWVTLPDSPPCLLGDRGGCPFLCFSFHSPFKRGR